MYCDFFRLLHCLLCCLQAHLVEITDGFVDILSQWEHDILGIQALDLFNNVVIFEVTRTALWVVVAVVVRELSAVGRGIKKMEDVFGAVGLRPFELGDFIHAVNDCLWSVTTTFSLQLCQELLGSHVSRKVKFRDQLILLDHFFLHFLD